MDDDEDLEFLRLAALKSLKKENVPTASSAIAPKSMNKIQDSHVIPVVSNVRPVTDKYYAAPGAPELIQPNLIHHPVPAYIDSGFEKMDITDAYVPQRLKGPPPSSASSLPLHQQQQPLPPLVIPPAYPEFNPYANDTDPITNVQLSPRSAAFVYENKKIIKQRQGIPSPSSPPPNPFRQSRSPARWSRTPSPDRIYHRKSRSPAYHLNHSPHYRNRSMSRSPQRRHSPQQLIAHARRNRSRSRSPILRANFEPNVHRSERRSPVPNRRTANNSSPINRHGPRQWRGHSPAQQHGMHARKSGSPRTDEPNARRRHRTRSPNATNANAHFRGQQDIRKRTDSRSPNRKNPRTINSSSRGRRATSPQQKRFNHSNGNKPGGLRNRAYNRRSGSPAQNRRSSNSPQNHYKRRSPVKNSPIENGDTSNKHGKDEKESIVTDQNERPTNDRKPIDNNDDDASNESNDKEKTEQDIEDELLASSDSDNSDNEESDGIDLFASEESESENEGRFKLSSSKNERKTTVPTLSFSELGKAKTAPADVLLRDLDEMQTDAMHSQSRRSGGVRRENDRNNIRNRHDTRKFNRDRDRTNRDRNRERDRDARDGDRNRDRSRRERESSKPKIDSANDKNDRKTTTLKSTFTSISENRTKTPTSGINF